MTLFASGALKIFKDLIVHILCHRAVDLIRPNDLSEVSDF